MSKLARIAKIAGIVGAVALVGILIGWLGTRTSAPLPNTTVTPGPLAFASNPAVTLPGGESNQASLRAHRPVTTVAPAVPDLLTNWEDNIDQILTAEMPEADKAKKMLELFPRLPEEGQVEVAQHLSNLVANEDYESLERYLTNTALPSPVLDVLVNDALNRPNKYKLPALLEVARDPQHPKADEAKDILKLFLEDDYGPDWTIWQAKVDQWLKDNPD